MASENLYYKVVCVYNDGSMNSSTVHPLFRWNAVYVKGEWTRPYDESTCLFVFSSFEHAKVFKERMEKKKIISHSCSFEVWSCEVGGIGAIRPVRSLGQIVDYWDYIEGYGNLNLLSIKYDLADISGSCSANAVKLIEKVG